MKEIRASKEQDLVKMLKDKQVELRNFRFGTAGSKTRNVKEGRSIRKTIAQIMTEMRARKTVK